MQIKIIYYTLFIVIFVIVAYVSQVKKEKYINYECEDIQPENASDPIDCKGKGNLRQVLVEKKTGPNGLPDVKIKYKCCYPEKNQICINNSCIKENQWKKLADLNTDILKTEIQALKMKDVQIGTNITTINNTLSTYKSKFDLLTAFSNNVQSIKTTLATVENTAKTAKSTADTANKTADAAKSAANTANNTANSIKATADAAKTSADLAKATADVVKNSVNAIKATADTAKTTADKAISETSTLQKIIETLKTSLGDALNLINVVKKDASDAKALASSLQT